VTVTWEALGALFAVIAAIVAANLFITRAIIQQELKKFRKDIRAIGECDLIHKLVDNRLVRLEVAGEKEG